jgi:hypothetical protein
MTGLFISVRVELGEDRSDRRMMILGSASAETGFRLRKVEVSMACSALTARD